MTDEILQADIDLARRLIDGGSADQEIIGALAQRNIAPNRAARLVAELRSGRAVDPDRVWRAVCTEPAPASRPQAASARRLEPRRKPVPVRVPWFRMLVAIGVG